MEQLPSERRLPESLRLPAGAPSVDQLRDGAPLLEDWCARAAADLSPDLLVLIDPLLRAVWTNGAVERLLGIPRGEMLGMEVAQYVHPDDLAVALGALNEVQRTDGYHVATRLRIRRRDGSYADTRVTATTITDDGGSWMVLALRPVEDEIAVERRRAQLKALAQSVYVECAAVHWYELGDRVPAMLGALAAVVGARTVELAEGHDGAFTRVAGWALDGQRRCGGGEVRFVADPERLRVAPCVVSEVAEHPSDDCVDCTACTVSTSGDDPVLVVEIWLDRDGIVRLGFDGYTETWDDANADVVALMCSTMLATMQRCEQESDLNTRATRDPLTGLLNRASLHQRLSEAVTTSAPGARPVVLFADLNRFKRMNDRFGHREGDIVLCRTADAIASSLRPGDVAARIGGDEFVVVLRDGDAPLEALVERVRSSVDAALEQWPELTVAMGAIVVQPGDLPEDVLDRADRAMYADKARLRGAPTAAWPGPALSDLGAEV